MKSRILQIDERSRRKARKIIRHAREKVNWYNPEVPGWMSRIPGHDPRHQCKLGDYRCVFSYTVDIVNDRVVRHISISLPGSSYPEPLAVLTIAYLFGFTGKISKGEHFPPSWVVGAKTDADPIDDPCIVVGQVIEGLHP